MAVPVRLDESTGAYDAAAAEASLHARLRAATRDAHVRLDLALSGFDLGDDVSYRRFLQLHRTALTRLLERCSVDDRREFAPLLDALHLDLDLPPPDIVDRTCNDVSSQVGIAYVIRGSRLGAAFLRRRVGPQFATEYLRCDVATAWPAFIDGLNSRDRSGDRLADDQVIAAARSAFQVFIEATDAIDGSIERGDAPNR